MELNRRHLIEGSIAWSFAGFLRALGADTGQIIPFVDAKPFDPAKPLLPWSDTTAWLTPTEHVFFVGHYGYPEVRSEDWKLRIEGLAGKPVSLSLADIRSRPKRELITLLECAGNGPAGGMIGNVRWGGTPLGAVLRQAQPMKEVVEAVFFAADTGTEKIRGGDYPQNFARSLPLSDAMADNVLLAYEMNGEPLNSKHGAPVRLVVPGHYGVAWVKWLNRIELMDRKYLGRFMGRDYVTIRGEKQGDQTIWRETSVGRMNLKSVVGRVVKRTDGSILIAGAAWSDGTPIPKIEVRIDEGNWMPAKLDTSHNEPFTWRFWSLEWRDAKPGEHSLASRATDIRGKVQPAPTDDFIALKKTYWEANQYAIRKIQLS